MTTLTLRACFLTCSFLFLIASELTNEGYALAAMMVRTVLHILICMQVFTTAQAKSYVVPTVNHEINISYSYDYIQQVNCTPGASCDDGNPCTASDAFNANCDCVGVFQDADFDGICDTDDICPNLDDQLIGTGCNDGDPCTINDRYTEDCACVGRFVDRDGDGICIGQDPDDTDACVPDGSGSGCNTCAMIIEDDFEGGFGNWNDGGSDCGLSRMNPNSGRFSVVIRDNSGVQSSTFTNILDLSMFSEVSIGFVFKAVSLESGEDFFLEISSDGGRSYNQLVGWKSEVHFRNDIRYNVSLTIPGFLLSSRTIFRIRCDASSNNDQVFLDDIILATCPITCRAGSTCDDGDDCTVGDVYDTDCNCSGRFEDGDNDGICDAKDVCPAIDDALRGGPCDDQDPCTSGDIIRPDCQCAGVYTDADGDGLCIGEDPDDNDGCNPNEDADSCDPCETIASSDFEEDLDIWNDGGGDCTRTAAEANSGVYSVRLRDNSGQSSSMFTDVLDLSDYRSITLQFSYFPDDLEDGEDFFVELSRDGGDDFIIIKRYEQGVDFQNFIRYQESVEIENVSANTVIRIRCDASDNRDRVFIDDVVLKSCDDSGVVDGIVSSSRSSNKLDIVSITPFPNPASEILYIQLDNDLIASGQIEMYNTNGQKILNQAISIGQNLQEVPVASLTEGIYLIRYVTAEHSSTLQRVVILR